MCEWETNAHTLYALEVHIVLTVASLKIQSGMSQLRFDISWLYTCIDIGLPEVRFGDVCDLNKNQDGDNCLQF